MEGDVKSGKGVKLALRLEPSTSTPKTIEKYCEESERCFAHTTPYPTVKISEVLELILTYNRHHPHPKKDNSEIYCIFKAH